MHAQDILHHFQSVGPWVNWHWTCDRILHGDPEREVTGIGCAWIITDAVVEAAKAKGLNVLVSHEPLWVERYADTASAVQVNRSKRDKLDRYGITVMRCHDTWDRFPEHGIPDAWATHLGFPTEPRPEGGFYKVCLLGEVTVEEAARQVLAKVRDLGQDVVQIFGDRERKVSRMAVGTGAITRLPQMLQLDADLLLATDDGMNFWDDALWATDLGIPLLIVNHCTAEKPGMMAMAPYLAGIFPGTPVEYLDVAFPYTSVSG